MSKSTKERYKTKGRAWVLVVILLVVNVLGGRFMWLEAGLDLKILLLEVVLAAFVTVISGTPLIMFLCLGWFARYSEFQNSLKGRAQVAYLQRFWSSRLIHSLQSEGKLSQQGDPEKLWRACADENPDLCERLFGQIYHEQYGLTPFVVPFIILLAVAYASAAIVACNYVAQTCPPALQVVCVYKLESPLLVSSLAGAFMFVVSDSVLSIRRKSLNISDVYWYSLRLFLAIPFALVIANGTPGGQHIVAAFALGTLPVDALMKVVRRMGFPQLTEQDKDNGNSDKLFVLEGVTLPVVAALEAEGINSIEQVAAADPVLLSIRTGFPFRFTLRLGSQAIVRRHLGEDAAKLLPVGLADVVPIYLLVQALDAQKKNDGSIPQIESPDLVVQNAAARLFPNDDAGERQAVTKMKFRQIAAEEYTVMLARITPPDIGL